MIASYKEATQTKTNTSLYAIEKSSTIDALVVSAWKRIAPIWPLTNLVATNPLQGYQGYRFADALEIADAYYLDEKKLPKLRDLNRETIKWAQVLLDSKHATIKAPYANDSLLNRFLTLVAHDSSVNQEKLNKLIKLIDAQPDQAIPVCLNALGIPKRHEALCLTLMLTTLPGWAGYVKYLAGVAKYEGQRLQYDYLTMRLILSVLLWPDAKSLIDAYLVEVSSPATKKHIDAVNQAEETYINDLIPKLHTSMQRHNKPHQPDAQFVFCIDPRSEPMRRAIESVGSYETFGYAGFFGIPLAIQDEKQSQRIHACPGMVVPQHDLHTGADVHGFFASIQQRLRDVFTRSYQALKYTFNTPFLLVDLVGLYSGFHMLAKTFAPKWAYRLQQQRIVKKVRLSLADKCKYAEQMLRTIGLCGGFAKTVVLCGHESLSQNNAYASALDCGACGGVSGRFHAGLMAEIMNNTTVREYLASKKIKIPNDTHFYPAVHVTSTDQILLLSQIALPSDFTEDLERASQRCQKRRLSQLDDGENDLSTYIHNWAQVRPEWGLVNNASLIIGPRQLTRYVNLESRSFLHSYDWQVDEKSDILSAILAGPVQVAFWINSSYLLASLDNAKFGAGSKIAHNITGKSTVMQGNASDVMFGLPMQSLLHHYNRANHQPVRLQVFIHAPLQKIKNTICANNEMTQLVMNEWLSVYAINPNDLTLSRLSRFHQWEQITNNKGGVGDVARSQDFSCDETS